MFRKLTLVVLSSFTIVLLCTAVLGASLQVLLYPDTYEAVFDKNNVYQMIEDRLVETGRIPKAIFARQPVKPTLNRFVDNFLSYIRGDAGQLDLDMNVSSTLNDLFLLKADEIRLCNQNESAFSGDEAVCRPANIETQEFMNSILAKKNISMSQFGNINMADVYDEDGNLRKVREGVIIFRYAVFAAFSLAILNLLTIAFLNRKSFILMVEWIDFDLVIVAATMIGTSYAVSRYLPIYFPESISAYQGILMGFVFAVLKMMAVYGFILLGVAAVFGVVALVNGKKVSSKS